MADTGRTSDLRRSRHERHDGRLLPVLLRRRLGGASVMLQSEMTIRFLPCGVSYLECGCMPVEDCWFTVTLCVLVKFIDLCGECVSGLSLFCLFSSGDS